VEIYLDSPNTPSRHGAQLKHRDNFTFYIYLQGRRFMIILKIILMKGETTALNCMTIAPSAEFKVSLPEV
jgi:hypothetical protein